MRICLLISLVALASPVRAERTGPGALKPTATVCTLEGPTLEYPDEIALDGLVVTPNGDVVVLDGDGKLRRYHVAAKGSSCKLALDRSFGNEGFLELASWSTPKFARMTIDRAGTIYVSVPTHKPLHISTDGKVTEMCGDDVRVNASPLSDRIWRFQYAEEATRETGACKELGGVARDKWDDLMSDLFVIDDRAVGYGKQDGLYVLPMYDRSGKVSGALPSPDPDQPWDPEEVTRCGAAICAINYRYLAVWHSNKKLIGQVALESLTKTFKYLWPIDLAVGKTGTFLLVRDNDPDHHDGSRPAQLLRIERLPTR